MNTTFIYTLADPRTGAIRYVGKSDDPAYRAKTHLRREHSKKSRWVQSLLVLGLAPVLELLDEVPFDDWMFWEQYWIQVLKGYGFQLLNMDNGGLGRYRMTPEIARRISKTLTGRTNPIKQRQVSSYDLDGMFLETFPSFVAAAKAVNGSHSNICRSIKKNVAAYGYLWRRGGSKESIETRYLNGKIQISDATRALLVKANRGKTMPAVSQETRAKMRYSAMHRQARAAGEPVSITVA